ncbi:MAG: hypothetical protein AB1489_33320 [Acidobacteriota bacterium]
MFRKPLAFILGCFLLLLTISVSSHSLEVGSKSVVNIPGQLQAANNVVFSRDGHYGFVASYQRADGSVGDTVYSFDTTTGNIVDEKRVSFSPTAIVINKDTGTMVVSGSVADSPAQAQLYILRANERGKFSDETTVASIEVPMVGTNDWVPDQVALTNTGYAIYSNKSSIYVFRTSESLTQHRGEIVHTEKIFPIERYGADNRLISIDYHPASGTLAAIWQKGNEAFSILLYQIDHSNGRLSPLVINPTSSPANEIVLPLGEVIGLGSNIAFNNTGTELYLVAGSSGNLYSYAIYESAGLVVKARFQLMASGAVQSTLTSPRNLVYRQVPLPGGGTQPILFMTRPRGIQRPGNIKPNAVVVVDPGTANVISAHLFEETEGMTTALSADGTTAYIVMSEGNFYLFDILLGEMRTITPLTPGTLTLALDDITGLLAATTTQPSAGTVNLIKIK